MICLIILLIAAVAGGTAWYMVQRHKPVTATEEFLTGMQNMDFTTMENLLQSHDLSALAVSYTHLTLLTRNTAKSISLTR